MSTFDNTNGFAPGSPMNPIGNLRHADILQSIGVAPAQVYAPAMFPAQGAPAAVPPPMPNVSIPDPGVYIPEDYKPTAMTMYGIVESSYGKGMTATPLVQYKVVDVNLTFGEYGEAGRVKQTKIPSLLFPTRAEAETFIRMQARNQVHKMAQQLCENLTMAGLLNDMGTPPEMALRDALAAYLQEPIA